MNTLAISPAIAATGELAVAVKDANDSYQTFQNNPNPSSVERFSAGAAAVGAAAYLVTEAIRLRYGSTAIATQLAQSHAIGIGGVSFTAGMASFSEALGRFDADPSVDNANGVLRGTADLLMGTGNLLLGAGTTLNMGASAPDTRLAAAGIYLVGLGAAMKATNDWSSNLDWSKVFDFFDTLAMDVNTALDKLTESFSQGFLSFALGLSGNLQDLIDRLKTLFAQAETASSPLILDLDGDGVETVSKSAGIYFDHDGNGYAELTGWADKDDGLLAWDRNGNGLIDSGAELFGNHTALANGSNAANGFAALAELDGNGVGRIDASDAAFASLRVWRDADQDGVADAGELLTLEEAGVLAIGLAYANSGHVDAAGNAHKQAGGYTRADGSSAALTDVWFAVDTARTIDRHLVDVPPAILALPEAAGFGNVPGLRQAMARDGSGRSWRWRGSGERIWRRAA